MSRPVAINSCGSAVVALVTAPGTANIGTRWRTACAAIAAGSPPGVDSMISTARDSAASRRVWARRRARVGDAPGGYSDSKSPLVAMVASSPECRGG